MALTVTNIQDLFQRAFVDATGNNQPALNIFVPAGLPATALSSGNTQIPVTASATGAAAAIAGTLAASAGRFTYITGFQVTGAGATAASVIVVTVTGVITGTMSYALAIPAGATVGVSPLMVTFPVPVPSSAANTAIAVNVPSFGAGNTNAAVSVQGFYA